jgi:uncharacterized protein (TIGR00255 family)
MNSMTGFSRAELLLESQHFILEIKSVNHRFLDVRYRLPQQFSGWESDLTEEIRKFCERGSLEVSVRHKLVSEKGKLSGNTRYAVDEKSLTSFLETVEVLESLSHKKWQLSLADIIATGRILIPNDEIDERAPGLKEFLPLFQRGLASLVQMRHQEGEKLKTILRDVIGEMRGSLERISALAPVQKDKVKEKLETRLAQWNLSVPVEPRRLEWEVAILAEKSDITEEIDRLQGHFDAFLQSLDSDKPIGRKLDFLTQELNREVNTIASKTNLMEITQLTVELKSNIEKLREQVQNVE